MARIEPLEPFFRSQDKIIGEKLRTLIFIFYKLYFERPDLFNQDVLKYFNRLAFDPSTTSIYEFKNIAFKRMAKKRFVEDFEELDPSDYMKTAIKKIGILENETNKSFLISKNYRISEINGKEDHGFVYKCYLQMCKRGNLESGDKEDIRNPVSLYLFIRDIDESEKGNGEKRIAFYEYYKNRNEKLFYPPEPFLPIHPFAVHPTLTDDFNYRKSKRNSFFVLDESSMFKDLVECNVNDYSIENGFILVPLITSPFDDFTEDKIEAGKTYIKLSNDNDTKHYFLITFNWENNLCGPTSVKKLNKLKKDLQFLKLDLESNITVYYSFRCIEE